MNSKTGLWPERVVIRLYLNGAYEIRESIVHFYMFLWPCFSFEESVSSFLILSNDYAKKL
jgi:hypothetical protein